MKINDMGTSKLILFHLGSNLSLYFAKIVINKFNIINYLIIFSGNNKRSFKKLFNFLNLNKYKLLVIEGFYNYRYLTFFLKKKYQK